MRGRDDGDGDSDDDDGDDDDNGDEVIQGFFHPVLQVGF